jgi:hypothetical protein
MSMFIAVPFQDFVKNWEDLWIVLFNASCDAEKILGMWCGSIVIFIQSILEILPISEALGRKLYLFMTLRML